MKILLSIMLLSFTFINQAQAADPTGLWLTENGRSVIKVENCKKGICGHIAWIIKGGMQYDTKNPQDQLKGQPMCGLQIMHSFKKLSDNKWHEGKIYKADDGDVYDATLTMSNDNEMVVRGYIGISLFGKSQTWKRVNLSNYPTCKKP